MCAELCQILLFLLFYFKTHSWHSFSILSFFQQWNKQTKNHHNNSNKLKNRKGLLRREGWGNDWDFWLHSLMLNFLYKLAFDRSCFFCCCCCLDEFNEFHEKGIQRWVTANNCLKVIFNYELINSKCITINRRKPTTKENSW